MKNKIRNSSFRNRKAYISYIHGQGVVSEKVPNLLYLALFYYYYFI